MPIPGPIKYEMAGDKKQVVGSIFDNVIPWGLTIITKRIFEAQDGVLRKGESNQFKKCHLTRLW